ncbi:hypothetical protein DCC81_21410 [Chitinophaga parva]|uniref:ABC transporter ATP-binding protein n=1 Tax=Chitinophaga parva TaxID=2169414 RepID=A0A2T7BCZ1_9BACT|nr:ABC transporter ATP-binding protein [Chitinophaga parva]PUZ22973.1 hypothetical protein DCC81_21410 [Chitinophaga parva]
MQRLFKNIWSLLIPVERKRVAFFVAGNTAVNLLDIACIACLLLVVKRYTNGQLQSLWPALGLAGLFILKHVTGHALYRHQVKTMNRIANRLSEANLAAYLHGSYQQFAGKDSSIFIRRIIHQPTEFAQYVLLNAQQLLSESMMVVFAVTALCWYNARLLGIITVALLPPALLLLMLTRRRLRRVKGQVKTLAARSLQYLREALGGFVEINVFRKHAYFIRRHAATQAELGHSIAQMQITQDLPGRVFEVFAILGLFLLVAAVRHSDAGYLVLIGAFMAAAYKIIPGISRIINLGTQLKAYQYSMDDLEAAPTAHAGTLPSPVVTLEAVGFAYPHATVLRGLDYQFKAGCLYGISGPSGQGKTTLFNLIAGFLEPGTGRIYSPRDLAYAKQEPFLLHTTIANNIVLFEENYDARKLQRVAALAGFSFPEGLEKMILEGGKNISGGQRQRIALARVLYKDAPVLLLDEPFSELDPASETLLLQHLRALAATGKTILLISHNPEAFQHCDVVLELSNNCIKERAVSFISNGSTGV